MNKEKIEKIEALGFKVTQEQHTKSCQWSGKTWTYPRFLFGDYVLEWFDHRKWIIENHEFDIVESEDFDHILNYLKDDGSLVAELEKSFDVDLEYCPYEDLVKIGRSKCSGYREPRWCVKKELDSYALWRNDFAEHSECGNGGYWQSKEVVLVSGNLEALIEHIKENGVNS